MAYKNTQEAIIAQGLAKKTNVTAKTLKHGVREVYYVPGIDEYCVFMNGNPYYIDEKDLPEIRKVDKISKNISTTYAAPKPVTLTKGTSLNSNKAKKEIAEAEEQSKYKFESATSKVTEPTDPIIDYSGAAGNYATSNTSTTNSVDTSDTDADFEKPEPKKAAEIAEMHGLSDEYNYDNILNNYNERTNAYYDAIIAAQNEERVKNDIALNNNYYNLIDNYLAQKANTAMTGSNKASLAANLLNMYLGQSRVNQTIDTGLLQAIQDSENQRAYELANNAYAAQEDYDDLGTRLAAYSTDYYNSDIDNIRNGMQAYTQKYAADRANLAARNTAAATKYSGLANAQTSNFASYNPDEFENLYNFYKAQGGNTFADEMMYTNYNNKYGGGK